MRLMVVGEVRSRRPARRHIAARTPWHRRGPLHQNACNAMPERLCLAWRCAPAALPAGATRSALMALCHHARCNACLCLCLCRCLRPGRRELAPRGGPPLAACPPDPSPDPHRRPPHACPHTCVLRWLACVARIVTARPCCCPAPFKHATCFFLHSQSFKAVSAAIGSHPGHMPVTLEFQKCDPALPGSGK